MAGEKIVVVKKRLPKLIPPNTKIAKCKGGGKKEKRYSKYKRESRSLSRNGSSHSSSCSIPGLSIQEESNNQAGNTERGGYTIKGRAQAWAEVVKEMERIKEGEGEHDDDDDRRNWEAQEISRKKTKLADEGEMKKGDEGYGGEESNASVENGKEGKDGEIGVSSSSNEANFPIEAISCYFPLHERAIEECKDAVAEWQEKIETITGDATPDLELLQHCRQRFAFHLNILKQFQTSPRPDYVQDRISHLKRALGRYTAPEDITNVRAAISFYRDGTLTDAMSKWSIIYNGNIVDNINSIDELRWSLRIDVYKELYGPEGSIWVEPPSGYTGCKYPNLYEPGLSSGKHWIIKQNIRLPYYRDDRLAKEFRFLLDSGATHPSLFRKDFQDMGMSDSCPHVATMKSETANGIVEDDFYPIFINFLDPYTNRPLSAPYDSICSVMQDPKVQTNKAGRTVIIQGQRLSGLDLWKFNYTGTEPMTGVLQYGPTRDVLRLVRANICPGAPLTPRVWERTDQKTGKKYEVSDPFLPLPRLLDPAGRRYVTDSRSYPYQRGSSTRTPPRFEYMPGHLEHPPTPDSVRKDRKWYWEKGLHYRDDRPYASMKSYMSVNDWGPSMVLARGATLPFFVRNPWQYLSPQERARRPKGGNPPLNPKGVRYWDPGFEEAARRTGLWSIPAIRKAIAAEKRKDPTFGKQPSFASEESKTERDEPEEGVEGGDFSIYSSTNVDQPVEEPPRKIQKTGENLPKRRKQDTPKSGKTAATPSKGGNRRSKPADTEYPEVLSIPQHNPVGLSYSFGPGTLAQPPREQTSSKGRVVPGATPRSKIIIKTPASKAYSPGQLHVPAIFKIRGLDGKMMTIKRDFKPGATAPDYFEMYESRFGGKEHALRRLPRASVEEQVVENEDEEGGYEQVVTTDKAARSITCGMMTKQEVK